MFVHKGQIGIEITRSDCFEKGLLMEWNPAHTRLDLSCRPGGKLERDCCRSFLTDLGKAMLRSWIKLSVVVRPPVPPAERSHYHFQTVQLARRPQLQGTRWSPNRSSCKSRQTTRFERCPHRNRRAFRGDWHGREVPQTVTLRQIASFSAQPALTVAIQQNRSFDLLGKGSFRAGQNPNKIRPKRTKAVPHRTEAFCAKPFKLSHSVLHNQLHININI